MAVPSGRAFVRPPATVSDTYSSSPTAQALVSMPVTVPTATICPVDPTEIADRAMPYAGIEEAESAWAWPTVTTPSVPFQPVM